MIIAAFGIVVLLILIAVGYVLGKFIKGVQKLALALKKRMIWNAIIRYMFQSTL